MFQEDTFKKLADILPSLKELSDFSLYGLTEAFNFASITDFLLKNENLVINLGYNEGIPLSNGYIKILESFIAKIIEAPPKRIPDIYFPGFEKSVYYQDYLKLYNNQFYSHEYLTPSTSQ
uniref:Uncharacterized protein n=1 Tax=Panagrolaimus superbus TaxID=310955 RepID=A0A914YXS8_9BILA